MSAAVPRPGAVGQCASGELLGEASALGGQRCTWTRGRHREEGRVDPSSCRPQYAGRPSPRCPSVSSGPGGLQGRG